MITFTEKITNNLGRELSLVYCDIFLLNDSPCPVGDDSLKRLLFLFLD